MNSTERYIEAALKCNYVCPDNNVFTNDEDYIMASVYIVIHNDILRQTVLNCIKSNPVLKVMFKSTIKSYIQRYGQDVQ